MTGRVSSDLRLLHGVIFVLLLGGALLIPPLRRWPWIWLAPFIGYFVIVAGIPRLRQSMCWLRFGNVTLKWSLITVVLMILTSAALVTFHLAVRPEVTEFRGAFPFEVMGGVVTAGIIFSLVNATLEEWIFRGILFDALHSQWSGAVTVAATSILFGLGHSRGYPPGLLGVGLAMLFGVTTGMLRLWTGGLALPIALHIVADATIYSLLMQSDSA